MQIKHKTTFKGPVDQACWAESGICRAPLRAKEYDTQKGLHPWAAPLGCLAASRFALIDRLALTRTDGVAPRLTHHRLACHPASICLDSMLHLDLEASLGITLASTLELPCDLLYSLQYRLLAFNLFRLPNDVFATLYKDDCFDSMDS